MTFLRKQLGPNLVWRLNFLTICIWLFLSIGIAALALLFSGQDFRGYYAAARLLLAGGNPYDYHALAPLLQTITGRMGNNPYYYSPWFAWLMIPFALLPYTPARYLWMAFNLVLWNFSLWELSKFLNWPALGWRRWLLFLLVTIVFARMTWRFEQTGILLFAILVQLLKSIKNQRDILSGIWLVLLLIKPNITLLPVLAILIWLLRWRRWKPVVILSALLITLFIVNTILIPNWYAPFLESGFGQGLFSVLNGPGTVVGYRVNSTLNDWLLAFHVDGTWSRIASMTVFAIGFVLLIINSLKSKTLLQVTVIALIINFAITPYALQYDYPVLTLALFWIMSLMQLIHRRWATITAILLFVLITSVPFWEILISDGYWMVIGFIGLALLFWRQLDMDKDSVSPSFV